MTSRRRFLAGIIAAGACPKPSWADVGSPAYLAAAERPDGRYGLFGLSAHGAVLFEVPLPGRGHAAAAHPGRPEAVAFARRPGTFAVVLDCLGGQVRATLDSAPGRHFYGHGAYSANGALLFTTENDYDAARGVIGVWDVAAGYQRVGEFDSGGVGPHDVRLMPDGKTLVVANGGIETHPDSGRAKLNLATMQPNLSYLDQNGRVLEQVGMPAEWHRNSLRHLAAGPHGQIACALQWEGDPGVYPPLLAIHRRGEPLAFLAAPEQAHRQMLGYAGSIAICAATDEVAITSPEGGRIQVFDLEGRRFARMIADPDVCGVSAAAADFIVTSGTGAVSLLAGEAIASRVVHPWQWDNHLVPVIG